MKQNQFTKITWGIFFSLNLLAIIAWLQTINWNLSNFSISNFFPLLGIFAWLTMWGHYASGYLRLKNDGLKKPRLYADITETFVLASLLLHPLLLSVSMYNLGQGLPPNSFFAYTGESMRLAVTFGSAGLFAFLAYEIFDRMRKNKTVQKYWWVISISQSIAMVLIFVHALRLGDIVTTGWFSFIWYACGTLMLPFIYTIHKADFEAKQLQAEKIQA